MLKFTTYANIYQFINIQLIACTNIQIILDINTHGHSIPKEWINIHLDPGMINFFSTKKVLVYHTTCLILQL
jgi:hypothetical protein